MFVPIVNQLAGTVLDVDYGPCCVPASCVALITPLGTAQYQVQAMTAEIASWLDSLAVSVEKAIVDNDVLELGSARLFYTNGLPADRSGNEVSMLPDGWQLPSKLPPAGKGAGMTDEKLAKHKAPLSLEQMCVTHADQVGWLLTEYAGKVSGGLLKEHSDTKLREFLETRIQRVARGQAGSEEDESDADEDGAEAGPARASVTYLKVCEPIAALQKMMAFRLQVKRFRIILLHVRRLLSCALHTA